MPLFWRVRSLKNFSRIPRSTVHIFAEASLEHILKNGKIEIIKIARSLVENIRRYFLISAPKTELQHLAKKASIFQMIWHLYT